MPLRALLIPSLALLAVPGAVRAADDLGFQIHGFASQGYIRTQGELYEAGSYGRDTNSGTFEFNEFALNVTATPIDRLRIGVQLIAYDLGKYGDDEVGLDWAFGEYQVPVTDWFQFSLVAGRFKTGHGFYNDYRDLDMTRTEVFLPRAAYTTSFRDFFLAANGGQINATIDAAALGSFDVSGFIGTQNVNDADGPIADLFRGGVQTTSVTLPIFFPNVGGATISNELSEVDNLTVDQMNGGYFTWNTPLQGLRLKVSSLYAQHLRLTGTIESTYTDGPQPGDDSLDGRTATSQVVIDGLHWFDVMFGGEYVVDNFVFAAEGSSQYYKAILNSEATQFESADGSVVFPVAAVTQTFTNRTLGAYGSVGYQFADLSGPLSRLSVYSAYNWIRSSSGGSPSIYTRSASVALRYDITDHFLIKGQFERVQRGDPGNGHDYGNVFSLKTTFDF
ncbi:MAG: hypothetical protein H0W78_12465 [Planctomycetes bacterium]|nr:hypothetical protein [Planctomycetota bacterium]